jgi:hypothetical protein
MNFDHEIYRQKYLKYKAKYLELKEQQGGILYGTGIYVFFYDTAKYKIPPGILNLDNTLNTFTDKIGNTAYYYRLSDKNVDNENFLIHQNRSSTEIASSKVEASARAAKRAAGKVAAAAKAAAARAACALLDKNWHSCKIEDLPEEVLEDKYSIKMSIQNKETNASDQESFINNARKIIKKLNELNKDITYGAVLLNVGSFKTQITQRYPQP